jgi:hypothetical protein
MLVKHLARIDMNVEQTATLSLRAAYAFGSSKGLEREVNEIRNMVIEWDSSYTSSLRRGYIVDLFERRGIFDEFKAKHWAIGNTPAGEGKRLRYLRLKKQYEDFLLGRGSEAGPGSEGDDREDDEQQFAAESDLRDFLAKNPSRIEHGLRLYQADGRSGVEFAIEGGYIDILAVDSKECFVVIELKVGRVGTEPSVSCSITWDGWISIWAKRHAAE